MNIRPAETDPFNVQQQAATENRLHPLRTLGPKYPTHDSGAPIFEGLDVAGFLAAAVITLGPLAAYSFGLGA